MVVSMLSIIVMRLLFDQWQSYNQGVNSLKKDNFKDAVMYFDHVLNAHVPFSPLERRAKENLMNLAMMLENKNEHELALLCYETIRSSRYLARHFVVPDGRDIPLLNDRIASIKARLLVRDGMVSDFKKGYEQQIGIMKKDFSPSVAWSLLAVASLFMYIGLVIVWILKKRWVYFIGLICAFIVWAAALYLA